MKENTVCEQCQQDGVLTGDTEVCSDECYTALPDSLKKLWRRRYREQARLYTEFLLQQ